jgi:hypothetical protein
MENGEIEDSQITSSGYFVGWEPSYGRLNAVNGAWLILFPDNNHWIQVCIHESLVFTAIATQSHGIAGAGDWVSSYAVSYSFYNEIFQNYTINGTRKVR